VRATSAALGQPGEIPAASLLPLDAAAPTVEIIWTPDAAARCHRQDAERRAAAVAAMLHLALAGMAHAAAWRGSAVCIITVFVISLKQLRRKAARSAPRSAALFVEPIKLHTEVM
jgi:hypothetical protein